MIFPYPENVRSWLRSKGRCKHCHQTYDELPCLDRDRDWKQAHQGASDHYRTSLDLAYALLDEEATEAELNTPQPAFEEIV